MKLLTKDKQRLMADQMCQKSRDIDLCMFNALDDTMPKDYLLDCLMLYQAHDGGFKGGLHIDNYNTNTSVYQIYEAFRLLDMLDFDSNCEQELFVSIINKACNYLYNRETPVDNKWNPNTLTNNNFAHAKIFEYNDENKKLFGFHPTAAIIGYTLLFNKPTKAYYKKALRLLDAVMFELDNLELTKYEAISFHSLLKSLKKLNILEEYQAKLENKLIDNALKNVSLDFNNPDALHPLEASLIIDNPKLNEMKEKELDFIIDSLKPFGLWDHIGGWGYDKYPEEDSAMLKWIGAETVNNFYLLKKCGRLE